MNFTNINNSPKKLIKYGLILSYFLPYKYISYFLFLKIYLGGDGLTLELTNI